MSRNFTYNNFTKIISYIAIVLSIASISACSGSTESTSDGNNQKGSATLSWQAPVLNRDNTELTNLVSYKIYYGKSPDNLNNSIYVNDPELLTLEIVNLTSNTTYFFTITAINSFNVESSFSNITSKYITG